MVKMFSNYQISILSHVKISYFYLCSDTTFNFSVAEILVKHCSLYNKRCYYGVYMADVGVYKVYMGVYKVYMGLYKVYMGVYKVDVGVYKVYIGVYNLYMGVRKVYMAV